MSLFKHSWKKRLLSDPDFELSNNHLLKLKELAGPTISFETAFEDISKNHGITFLSLDPTESFLQLFHHNQVFGGNWDTPEKTFVN
jgi:hypothetical protein